MFDQLVKRSNAVWIYTTGRFVEERRAFLCMVGLPRQRVFFPRNTDPG